MPDKFLTNHFIQRILSTLPDSLRSVSLLDRFDLQKGVVVMRGLEAGPGIRLEVNDADNTHYSTRQTKIVISATGAGSGGSSLSKKFIPIDGQTDFDLSEATTVEEVTINGIGISEWEFNYPTLKILDPGYTLDSQDEMVVWYN